MDWQKILPLAVIGGVAVYAISKLSVSKTISVPSIVPTDTSTESSADPYASGRLEGFKQIADVAKASITGQTTATVAGIQGTTEQARIASQERLGLRGFDVQSFLGQLKENTALAGIAAQKENYDRYLNSRAHELQSQLEAMNRAGQQQQSSNILGEALKALANLLKSASGQRSAGSSGIPGTPPTFPAQQAQRRITVPGIGPIIVDPDFSVDFPEPSLSGFDNPMDYGISPSSDYGDAFGDYLPGGEPFFDGVWEGRASDILESSPDYLDYPIVSNYWDSDYLWADSWSWGDPGTPNTGMSYGGGDFYNSTFEDYGSLA
jgi:hypothetical protein